MSYSGSIACVTLTGDGPASPNTLYFEAFSPELSVYNLGVFTTMRLDIERLVAGALQEAMLDRFYAEADDPGTEGNGSYEDVDGPMPTDGMPDGTTEGQDDPAGPDNVPEAGTDIGQADPEEATEPMKPYNVMDIDFEALMASGQDDPLYPMHKYFSSVEPTPTNEYTGMFRAAI